MSVRITRGHLPHFDGWNHHPPSDPRSSLWWLLNGSPASTYKFTQRRWSTIFTFSSHTEYVKRESIVITQVKKKKKFSPFDKCLWFLCLRRQKQAKKHFRPSVCLSGCLDVHTYVDFSCGHNNFRRSYRIQTKFGGCLLCMECRSGIEIQSNTMILILTLILNRILIFTKTLRSDTKFLQYL